jgi:hypothetical protein
MKDTLLRRIRKLRLVQTETEGWRYAVIGRDKTNACTDKNKLVFRQKSLLLCKAYILAVKLMNKKTWLHCCAIACARLNEIGITQTKNSEVLADYNRTFRKEEAFPHPNIEIRAERRLLDVQTHDYTTRRHC